MLQRAALFNDIEYRLTHWLTHLASRNKLNLTESNVHGEDFMCELLNELWGCHLHNANCDQHNQSGYDLIDPQQRLLVQITSERSASKLKKTLQSPGVTALPDFHLKIVVLKDSKSAAQNLPDHYNFDPEHDYLCVADLLKEIKSLPLERLEAVHRTVAANIPLTMPPVDSYDLSRVVQALYHAGIGIDYTAGNVVPFNVSEKIESNALTSLEELINQHAPNAAVLQKQVYDVLDHDGHNVSVAILQSINREYLKLADGQSCSNVQLFFKLHQLLSDRIAGSEDCNGISREQLELCMDTILVDAFIKCRIFKHPREFSDASA